LANASAAGDFISSFKRELPIEFERKLSRLLVTPRLHGIHHSVVQAETDSNWSSGLSIWDRLHGTLQTDVSAPKSSSVFRLINAPKTSF
jgi:sterol desaturase/sphingolipid hydroxylase (fatty acid hydroxylase superfamily)